MRIASSSLWRSQALEYLKVSFLISAISSSIENDLSTYSSHLKNMSFFLENAHEDTLVLMDELGAGTDPNFGGGIAEAILSSLLQKKVWVLLRPIITIWNCSRPIAPIFEMVRCQFDTKKLQPLFQLEIGKPGSSFALEIARKTGLLKQPLSEQNKSLAKSWPDWRH